ncbi:hypothetical protein CK203_083001 [Vitis vinifera]|uniref:Uncharacterized protein n=1 Tax=Vitis vinifera TaxID=29760 RepID=A0A438E566_VITVI|nr:hypothetical protein CK203_083001 [Vitis vinifera]
MGNVAADGRLARAEECGGWQEATASLLRKTRTEEKEKERRKGGSFSLRGVPEREKARRSFSEELRYGHIGFFPEYEAVKGNESMGYYPADPPHPPWQRRSSNPPPSSSSSPTSTHHQHQFFFSRPSPSLPTCMQLELYVHGHLPLHLYFSLFLSNTEPTTCTIIQTAISVTTQAAICFVFCHRGRRFFFFLKLYHPGNVCPPSREGVCKEDSPRRRPSSSSRALRSRAGSPRRRHVVRHALLRPGEQPRQSSPTAATSLGAAGSKSSIGGRLPGERRRCGEDEGLVFGLGLRLGPVLSLVLGLDYEGFGLGFEFGAYAQAYAEYGAFVLSPFLLLP